MTFLHYHNTYELMFIESGERTIMFEESMETATSYSVVLIDKNTMHRTVGSHCTRTLIYLSSDCLDNFFTHPFINSFLNIFRCHLLKFEPSEFEYITELLKKIMAEHNNVNRNIDFYLHLGELLLLLKKKCILQMKDNVTYSQANTLTSHILNYINQNYTAITSLDELAQHFNFTKNHLCRIFKKETSLTINQYIVTLKLKKACELLTSTNLSSIEISIMCGFNSNIYFSQCFKRKFALSPIEYRKRELAKAVT